MTRHLDPVWQITGSEDLKHAACCSYIQSAAMTEIGLQLLQFQEDYHDLMYILIPPRAVMLS